jgi:SAM-dependent methyltransferase
MIPPRTSARLGLFSRLFPMPMVTFSGYPYRWQLAKDRNLILTPLKRILRTGRASRNPAVRLGIGVFDFMRGLARAATSREYRSVLLLRWLKSGQVHQTTPLTLMDRYPETFKACRDLVGGDSEIRILSFGCSTGEEVLTLRRYFPRAFITGAEINPRSLALCRRLKVDDRISFVESDLPTLEKLGHFDLISCMAVLQRTPHFVRDRGLKSLKKLYPFEKFDRQVSELDGLLKKGGLFIMDNAQYLFTHASVAGKYETVEGIRSVNEDPRFDRNSLVLEESVEIGAVFRKRAD